MVVAMGKSHHVLANLVQTHVAAIRSQVSIVSMIKTATGFKVNAVKTVKAVRILIKSTASNGTAEAMQKRLGVGQFGRLRRSMLVGDAN